MSTPTRAPPSASRPARAATMAADRSSWTPPAKSRSSSSRAPPPSAHAVSTSIWASHRAKLDRGPTCPPHSKPSNTNRRAPSLRNRSSRPGAGTCRNVRMPTSSSARRLGRAPAGDEGHGRAHVADDGELLVAQLLRDEAQHADAPRPVTQQLGGLLQQRAHLGLAPQQREGEERQPPAGGDRLGEGGAVGHPGHRALDDRIGGAHRGGDAVTGGQRLDAVGGLEVGGDLVPQPGDHATDGAVAGGEPRRERGVLPGRQCLVGEGSRAEAPGDLVGRGGVVEVRHPQVGAAVDPVAADDPGFAAVHGGDGGPDRPRQRRLAEQRGLGVDHDAGRTADHRGGRGVAADAALHPDRRIGGGPDLLQQHEGTGGAHPPAALGAAGDEAVGAGGEGVPGFVEGAHLGDDPALAVPPRGRHPDLRHHDGAHGVGQVVRGERAPPRTPGRRRVRRCDGSRRRALRGPGRRPRRDRARRGHPPGPRRRRASAGLLERCLDPDQVVLTGARKSVGHHESPSSPSIVRSALRERRRHCGPYLRCSPDLLTCTAKSALVADVMRAEPVDAQRAPVCRSVPTVRPRSPAGRPPAEGHRPTMSRPPPWSPRTCRSTSV